jgi:hypothetical protein
MKPNTNAPCAEPAPACESHDTCPTCGARRVTAETTARVSDGAPKTAPIDRALVAALGSNEWGGSGL